MTHRNLASEGCQVAEWSAVIHSFIRSFNKHFLSACCMLNARDTEMKSTATVLLELLEQWGGQRVNGEQYRAGLLRGLS